MKTKGMSAAKLSPAVILGLSHPHPVLLCLESHMFMREAESESASDDHRQMEAKVSQKEAKEPAHTLKTEVLLRLPCWCRTVSHDLILSSRSWVEICEALDGNKQHMFWIIESCKG